MTTTAHKQTPSETHCSMATLDHAAFPHIMEAIVSHASPEVLIALRATSKAYLELANSRLFTHVAWRRHYILGMHLVPSKTVPGEVEIVEPPFSIDDLRLTPCDSFHYLPFLPHLVKIVDLHHWYGGDWEEISGVGFSAVHTVRRLSSVELPELHPDVAGITTVDFFMPWYDRPRFEGIAIRNAVARSIIHFKFAETDWTEFTMKPRLLDLDDERLTPLEEVVIVLWPVPSEFRDVYPSKLLFVFALMLNTIFKFGGVTFTVVGMEDVDEVQGASNGDDLWEQYVEYEDDYFLPDGMRENSEKARHKFRLLTREEWWAELGDRKETEGVWPDAAWATTEQLPGALKASQGLWGMRG